MSSPQSSCFPSLEAKCKSPFFKPQLAVAGGTFVLKHCRPPGLAVGQLKSSVIPGCHSPRGVLGCVGVLQPRKSSLVFWFWLLCSGCAASSWAKALEGGRGALFACSPRTYILTEPGLILTSSASSVPPTQQVNQDLSRQLLQDGYHLDEVPDDEDLDLIPPKPIASSSCPCCFRENFCCVIQ